MKTSTTRFVGIALGVSMAVGALFATIPANADPEDDATPVVSTDEATPATSPDTTPTIAESSDSASPEAATPVASDTPVPVASDTPAAAAPVAAAEDAGPNLIQDATLRTCLAQMLSNGTVTKSPESITQEDLDAIAAGSIYNIYCPGVSTLSGLENLTNGNLTAMAFPNGSITDLTPLSGITGLNMLTLTNNKITSLAPLSGLTTLVTLEVGSNQITSLAGVEGMTHLGYLVADNNQISSVDPLKDLTSLMYLTLNDNNITDIAPIAPILNATQSNGTPKVRWTLAFNQIRDASSLDWNVMGTAWMAVPSEYQSDVYPYTVTGQSIRMDDAVAGTTIKLPEVKQPTNDPYKVRWYVLGNGTLNDDNTLTFDSYGGVALSWIDDMTVDCPANSTGTSLCPDNANKINLGSFSGTFNWYVSDGTTTGMPIPTESDVAKPQIISPDTTGGAARLADGSDTYTLLTSIRNANGDLLPGYVKHLGAYATSDTGDDASQVQFSAFRPNPELLGTYLVDVSSPTPGNYNVYVTFDKAQLETTTDADTPIVPSNPTAVPVNFIGADIAELTRYIGDTQSSDGLGFLPGEEVTVTVHSDPMNLGSYKADARGNLNVGFLTDKLDVGRHTVNFVGVTSGTVMVGFDVISKPKSLPEGGASSLESSGQTALILVVALAAAGVFSLGMGLRRRTH